MTYISLIEILTETKLRTLQPHYNGVINAILFGKVDWSIV